MKMRHIRSINSKIARFDRVRLPNGYMMITLKTRKGELRERRRALGLREDSAEPFWADSINGEFQPEKFQFFV